MLPTGGVVLRGQVDSIYPSTAVMASSISCGWSGQFLVRVDVLRREHLLQ